MKAARADEAGKGFSVVADAIRNLEKQSQNTTGNIRNIIQSMQTGIKDTELQQPMSIKLWLCRALVLGKQKNPLIIFLQEWILLIYC